MQTTSNSTHLIRSEIWSSQLKDILEDTLDAQRWVDWLDEFPDGTTFTIPSIGQATVQDVVEDTDITYEALDTGEFQFTVNEYIASAHYMTKKLMHDSFYANRVMSEFVPKEARAIGEHIETSILKSAGPDANQGGGQTTANANAINGHDHRFVGTGTNNIMRPEDFAKAALSLTKAHVPERNRIGIVDPTVAYHLETATNLVNVSNNPHYEGIIETGLMSSMRFVRNIYGFDVYTSNYLNVRGAAETINSVTTTADQTVENLFFSADEMVLPIVGVMRQMPNVDSEFNKDKQREEYITTAYYDTKLYRPENMVVVLSDNAQV